MKNKHASICPHCNGYSHDPCGFCGWNRKENRSMNDLATDPDAAGGQQTEIPGTRPDFFDDIDKECQKFVNLREKTKKAEKAQEAQLAILASLCTEHEMSRYRYTPVGGKALMFTDEVENSWRCRQATKKDD